MNMWDSGLEWDMLASTVYGRRVINIVSQREFYPYRLQLTSSSSYVRFSSKFWTKAKYRIDISTTTASSNFS